MTHLESFLKMFHEQQNVSITGWSSKQHKVLVKKDKAEGRIIVRVEDNVFVFGLDGNFIGMVNCKE